MGKFANDRLKALLENRPDEAVVLSDGFVPGLSIRIGPHAATWSMRLRVAGEGGTNERGSPRVGKQHRICLGDYPSVGIEAARSTANSYLDQAKRGINPLKALQAQATAGGLTVAELGREFMTDYVELKRLRASRKYQMAIEASINPNLGTMYAELVTRDDVRTAMKKVMEKQAAGKTPRHRPRGGIEAARTYVTVLRKLFAWAMDEGKIRRKDNPASDMAKNLPRKRRGERVLSMDEIRLAWRAASTLGYPFGPVYQLVMLTGDRRGAWGNVRKSQIDLNQKLLVVSAEDYKSDRVHVVPLVDQSTSIIQWTLRHHPVRGGEYIFSGTEGQRGVQGWPRAQKRMLDACFAETGTQMRRWTPHDLRRTVASMIAAALGIQGERFLKRVLDHADGSATAIYNRYSYINELREVLSNWTVELTKDQQEWSFSPYDSRVQRATFTPTM